MLVVKIELWPKGDASKAREIGRIYIENVGGSAKDDRGNYKVSVCKKGTTSYPGDGITKAVRHGEVLNFPRVSYNVWRLVTRALLSAFPEEK